MLVLVAAALAAPYGSPARSTADGAVAVQGLAATESRALQTGCDGDRCASWGVARLAGGRVDLRAHDAVGVWAGGGYLVHDLSGTGHSGQGALVTAGLSAQWPRDGLRPALLASAEGYRTTATGDSGSTRSTTQGRALRVAGLAVAGGSEGGASGWLGPTWTPIEEHQVQVVADDVEVALTAKRPVGAVVGGELTSDGLGPAWRRSAHLVAGAEVQLVDSWGLAAWFGVTY